MADEDERHWPAPSLEIAAESVAELKAEKVDLLSLVNKHKLTSKSFER